MNTTVNDCLFDRLQAILSTYDQLAQRKDEIGFQSHGVIFLRVVGVDVHRVDILRTGRADYKSCESTAEIKFFT